MNNDGYKSARERQDPLRTRYKERPEEAWITDRAKTISDVTKDPFHGVVLAGSRDYGIKQHFGIHQAVGGFHDAPNPGDILCAALATCLDSTIRIIADRLAIQLASLEVDVAADVDVRGTLLVDRNVPVRFQKMRCQINIRAAEDTDPKLLKTLIDASEHSCVNLQTLRSGVSVETIVNRESDIQMA